MATVTAMNQALVKSMVSNLPHSTFLCRRFGHCENHITDGTSRSVHLATYRGGRRFRNHERPHARLLHVRAPHAYRDARCRAN